MLKDLKYYTTTSVPYPKRDDYHRFNVFKQGDIYGSGLTLEEVYQLPQLQEPLSTLLRPKSNADHIDQHSFIAHCQSQYNITIFRYILEAEFKAAKAEHGEEIARLTELFKLDLFNDCDVEHNPKRELCFAKAWEHGHSSGLHSVASIFKDLVELIQ